MSGEWDLFSESENENYAQNEPMEEDEPGQQSSITYESSASEKGNTPPHTVTFKVTPELAEYLRGKPFLTMNRAHKYLRENCTERISRKASAALIGVTQGLMIDLLKDVALFMEHHKTKRISPKIISMVVQNDEELSTLLSNVSIVKSGMYGAINHMPLSDDDESESESE